MSNLRANFFKSENGIDMVELSIIGDPNSVIHKVESKAEEFAKNFPREWAEFYKDKKIKVKKETNLDVLECMNKKKIDVLKLEGITSVEQLAELSDGACHGLGKGTIDYRKEAKEFLMDKHDIKPLQVVGS
tara:strand:- start:4786 stop:5178 length:393 start_codon:yes stop_codon:yes gene_type:complete